MEANPKKQLREVPWPGYVAENPVYPSVRTLNQISGMQDTFINLVELSICFFEKEIEKQDDPETFVKNSCDEFRINSSLAASWDEVGSNAHKFALVQAVSVADEFIRDLTREYREYRNILDERWVVQKNGGQLDPLTALLENLPAECSKRAKSCPEFDLWQYYRLVRNRIVHRGDIDTSTERAKFLGKHEKHFKEGYGVIPKEAANIGYQDFLLFTRTLKYFAKILNDVCDLTVDGIANFLLSDQEFVSRIRRYKQRPRKIEKVSYSLGSRYWLNENQTNELCRRLNNFIENDPPAKVRKELEAE